MNIEADALATKALKGGKSRPIVPFNPATGAMLTINGHAITRRLEATIQRHENTAPLTDYYLKRFHWCTLTFQTIDWDSFSMAYSRCPRTCTFFHKLGWKQLPTGARLHRWSPSFDHQCPSCGQDAESDNHLFQCNHPLWKQWRKDLLNSLHDAFSSFLDHDLFTVPKIGLQGFFVNVCPLFEERFPCKTYPALRELTDQQTAIGWDQFVR
jgi:zinc-binding in reverse transcriptase